MAVTLENNGTVAREVSVNMGEIKCADSPAVFHCKGVGSCVILFVYEARRPIGGVAHIMLPDYSAGSPFRQKTYYADTSTEILLQKLKDMGADPARLRAKILGGANIFSWAGSAQMAKLGDTNIEIVKKTLLKNHIYLAAEEKGNRYQSVRCHLLSGNISWKTERDVQKFI